MTNWNLFDGYSFRARLQPAFCSLLPAALGVVAWAGFGEKWMSALWTLLGSAGVTYALALLARNAGKRIEPGLWQSWGGAPTTQLLRHSGPANSVMRARWHENLSRLLEKPFPTAEAEAANPLGADEIYEAAVRLQIGRTRDTKRFPLLFKENVQYGFCRNLYAMRGLGIVISGIGILTSIAAGVWLIHTGNPQPLPWICAAISCFLLVGWVFIVTSAWVRIPAFAYAERLMESTETVASANRKTAKKKT